MEKTLQAPMLVEVPKMGVYKPGWRKNAQGQIKKKASQMSTDELDYLYYKLKGLSAFRIHPHLQAKREKGLIRFDILTIQRMFHSRKLRDQIKEYSEVKTHNGSIDRRVLIRSNKRERVFIKERGWESCNLVFVFSLETREVITAYYTNRNFMYERVNEARYDETLNVIKFGNASEKGVTTCGKEEFYGNDFGGDI